MFLYTVIEAVAAVITGIVIAVCVKKTDGVTYATPSQLGEEHDPMFVRFCSNKIRCSITPGFIKGLISMEGIALI